MKNVDLLVFCFCYFCLICDAAVARPVPFTGLGSAQFLESRNVLHCSVVTVEVVLDTPTHTRTRGRGCTDAASPGSPFCSLGVGCRWQTESCWGLRGSCCQELGKWERGSPVTKQDSKSCCQGRIQPFHKKKSLSSSWRPEMPSAVGLTISLTHLYLYLSEVPKMRGRKT